jgi:uncharacterized protein YjbI with pentapeptide repeats
VNLLPDDPPPAEALFGIRPPLPRAATLEELDKIVENSSEKNRNFFIAYLGLLIYVQAIVFSTTDLQLLVSTEGLRLPIIDLNVPLVGFYVVVPIFVIALHFNFLQNLESHHYKLMRWREAHPDGQVPRSRIQPFLFDYAELERGSLLEPWVRAANTLLVLNFAPFTLGLLLLRYTDRQDGWVTAWHWVAFFFDTYLVWKLRLAFDRNRSPDRPPPRRSYWRDIPRHGLRGAFGLFLLFETGLTAATAWLPSEAFVEHVLPFARSTEALEREIAQGLLSFAKDWKLELPAWLTEFLGTFKDGEDTRLASWVLPRIAIDPNEKVWTPDEKALATEARLAGETDWAKHFNQQGHGFLPSSPKPANLRMVRLPSQHLPRAQLEQAKLEGAFLVGIELQSADLVRAQLRAANLNQAQLQAADLSFAQLQAANLSFAQLQAATLTGAELQATILLGGQLQAASLREAQLQAANLFGAQLQAADLFGAQLQAATLREAHLDAANLMWAYLQAADLSGAQLQAALLHATALFGASPPAPSAVFLEKPPFDDSPLDWESLESLASGIPEGEQRDGFLKRIRQARTQRNDPATPAAFIHDPAAVYGQLLPKVCAWKDRAESRRAAVRGIRRNYQAWQVWATDPGFPKVLTEIDRTLCTLPACADLKGDIEGLDCGPFAAAKPSTESKR